MAYAHKDAASLNTHLATRSYVTGCARGGGARGGRCPPRESRRRHPRPRARAGGLGGPPGGQIAMRATRAGGAPPPPGAAGGRAAAAPPVDHPPPSAPPPPSYQASRDDLAVYAALPAAPDAKAAPHAARWYSHITALLGAAFPGKPAGVAVSGAPAAAAAPAAKAAAAGSDSDSDDEELDLFGDMTPEEQAAADAKKKVIEEAKARGAAKAKLTKSMIVLDVKPWDDETDLAAMEAEVRAIVKDGLLWGASKLVPIGYGIKKMQITAIIEGRGDEGGGGWKGRLFPSFFFSRADPDPPSFSPPLQTPRSSPWTPSSRRSWCATASRTTSRCGRGGEGLVCPRARHTRLASQPPTPPHHPDSRSTSARSTSSDPLRARRVGAGRVRGWREVAAQPRVQPAPCARAVTDVAAPLEGRAVAGGRPGEGFERAAGARTASLVPHSPPPRTPAPPQPRPRHRGVSTPLYHVVRWRRGRAQSGRPRGPRARGRQGGHQGARARWWVHGGGGAASAVGPAAALRPPRRAGAAAAIQAKSARAAHTPPAPSAPAQPWAAAATRRFRPPRAARVRTAARAVPARGVGRPRQRGRARAPARPVVPAMGAVGRRGRIGRAGRPADAPRALRRHRAVFSIRPPVHPPPPPVSPSADDAVVDTKQKAAPKPRAKRAAPKAAPAPKKAKAAAGSDSDATMDEADTVAPTRRGAVGSGRAAAQGAVYEDAPALGAAGDETVALKDVAHAESEAAALTLLGAGGEPGGAYAAFDVVAFTAGSNEKAHLHTAPFADPPIFVSAVVARSATERAGGYAVASIGPVTAFAALLGGGAPTLTFSTAAATFVLRKPAASYKKAHTHLAEQAELAHEARAALTDLGADADFAAVCARLTRKRPAAVAAYGSASRALGACGHFVRDALAAADAAAGTSLATGAFGAALVDAVARARAELAGGAAGIVIKDDPVAATGKGKAAAAAAKGKGKAAAGIVVAPLPTLTPAALRERADADLSVQLELKQRVKEVEKAAGGGSAPRAPKSGAYYQISETEIADDYPPPTVFDAPAADQMDELLLADEGVVAAGPDALPTCLLTDFAVYDAEGFLKSLELLPLWSGVQPDVELFATGAVTQLEGGDGYDEAAALAASAAAGAGGSGSGSSAAQSGPYLALSAIQEWVLEAGGDRVDVLIRTDVSWYRLVTPSKAYAPYMAVVAKAGAVALALWRAIEGGGGERARAARLSLDDAAKALAALPAGDAAFVSAKPAEVARFLAVHGQLLLTQLQAIETAARVAGLTKTPVATALLARLAERRHTVLYRSAKPTKKGAAAKRLRANPLKDRAGRKAAPMTATATAMVRFVWQSYFKGAGAPGPEDEADAAAVEDDVNADDGDDDAAEDALASPAPAKKRGVAPKKAKGKVALVGAGSKGINGATVYGGATVGAITLSPGDVVELAPAADAAADSGDDESPPEPVLAVVQALYTAVGESTPRVQARVAARGADTVLGDAASDAELFVTASLVTRPLADVSDKLVASRRVRAWRAADRRAHLAEDTALAAANAAAAAGGTPLTHFYRSFYEPERGMFRVIETGELRAGELLPEVEPAPAGVRAGPAANTFSKDGVVIAVGDAVFLPPDSFDGAAPAGAGKKGGAKKRGKRAASDSDLSEEDEPAAPIAPIAPKAKAKPGSRSKFHKGGANVGLRAYAIGLVTAIPSSGGRSGPATITVTRYARPEDVSDDVGYAADWWDVYATAESVTVATGAVVGRASIVAPDGAVPGDNVFACRGTVDLATKAITAPPAGLAREPVGGDARRAPPPARPASKSTGDGVSLATMDIFAGCGGLSEGMHLAGAAHPKWAIEYEAPAAEAYKLNNPDATTFVDNCNVILAAAMRKAGCGDDCEASDSCMEAVDAMEKSTFASLPAPGDVEFLCGGPPCQGYSGMNRFNKGNWSMVQNSMVMSYLSFCDFYRPRYFLLENVRNFVSHNKSFTFRLTLRSLLEMGYSVRFGVLNAGNFGVSQSRKRTFIWAAAPGDALPDWPAPRHVFKSPQLTINLPGGVAYTAVRQTVGAPVRSVTVRDAIGDLPPVSNGEDAAERPYAGPAQSAFQRAIRGANGVLYDHVCKVGEEGRGGGGRGGVARARGAKGPPPTHPHTLLPSALDHERPQHGALPLHPQGRARRRLARAQAGHRRRRGGGRRRQVPDLPRRPRRRGRQRSRRPDPVVPAQHRGPPQRVARPLWPARPRRPLPHLDHRPPAHGQGGPSLPPGPGPHCVGARVRARAGVSRHVSAVGQRAPKAPPSRQRGAGAAGGRAGQAAAGQAGGDGGGAGGGAGVRRGEGGEVRWGVGGGRFDLGERSRRGRAPVRPPGCAGGGEGGEDGKRGGGAGRARVCDATAPHKTPARSLSLA